jgi:dihydroorotase-like cyclic amidohydrolase
MLPLLLTVAAGKWPHPAGKPCDVVLSYEDITRLCFENPNRIFSLGASGTPRVEINLAQEWILSGEELHAKCGWTPYEGGEVRGKVTRIL